MNAPHHTGRLRAALLVLIGFALVAGWPRTAQAQDSSRVTATMLRRVAEAVAGQTSGTTAWVVVAYDFPHRVIGVAGSRADAVRLLPPRAEDAEIFGPYAIGPIVGGWLPPDCIHVGPSNYRPRICPDPIEPMPPAGPDSITVTMHVAGRSITRVLPRGADAVFFTLPALDKFFFPYYADVLGVEEASRMRQGLVERLPR